VEAEAGWGHGKQAACQWTVEAGIWVKAGRLLEIRI
jgi:hypothetical protein